MEQLRQVGEALGGINALMAFRHHLRVNPRQCRLLADACALAFHAVAGEVRAHLRFDDRLAKWKPLDAPLRELHRAVRDAELYIRQCLEPRDWWARAVAATHGTDCVEHHLHALLWCVAVVLEAVEAVAEVTGASSDELAMARLAFSKDYDKDLLDPNLFRRRLGEVYLATEELAERMDMAAKEDRWLLSQLLDEKKGSPETTTMTRHEHRIAELLAAPRGELHPASLLLGGLHMRRRLGGSLKEVQWLGEAFAVKHLVGADADAAAGEIALLTAVAHPNVAHCRYCFRDEEKREVYLVMDQLMAKDLGCFVKEATGGKRRQVPIPLVVVVDVMLQIARGMEHLHSKKIYHGDLNPSNVLVKPRQADAYLHVKVAGLGRSGEASSSRRKASGNAHSGGNPCIWHAPEVLEQEGSPTAAARCTEKADVYSFAMICFELLTGKIPFEDNHLQGDNTSKNIRAGERPLFPLQSPKYLAAVTKRCWHADPAQRPAFSSICRVLRYAKRFLVLNPDQPDSPGVDYLDIEAHLLRKFPEWQGGAPPRVSDVPFQMYAYRVMEKERTKPILHIGKDKGSDSSSDGNSLCSDESVTVGFGAAAAAAALPDVEAASVSSRGATTRSLPDRSSVRKASPRKLDGNLAAGKAGPPQKSKSMGVVRPPQIAAARRTPRIKSDGQLRSAVIPPSRRRMPGGHASSDSELA